MEPNGVLQKIADLLPAIRARRQEIEQARRMPQDLVGDLRRTGIFTLSIPLPLGGVEAALEEQRDRPGCPRLRPARHGIRNRLAGLLAREAPEQLREAVPVAASGRAARLIRVSEYAAWMCTPTATSSRTRAAHSIVARGSAGSPISRSHSL